MSALHLKLFLELNRAHAVATRRFAAELGSVHGLGLNDLQLLSLLADAPEARLRRIDLAQALGVTPSGVTWMLRPLAKRRLVTSQASASDARVTFAVLTDAGRRLIAETIPSARQLAAELLGTPASKQELTRVTDLLARLT
jgi:DNA-binding MarR family transcriptional regulator